MEKAEGFFKGQWELRIGESKAWNTNGFYRRKSSEGARAI